MPSAHNMHSASSRPVTRRSRGVSTSGPTWRSLCSSKSPSPASGPSTQSKRGQQRRSWPANKRPKQATSGCDGGDGQERWRNPAELDVEPPRPKFEPKNPVGPRIDTTMAWSPLSLFKLFFSSSVIHTIVNNTNEKPERRKASGMQNKWSPLSAENFYAFLAIIILSGIVQAHTMADMWRREWPYNLNFPWHCMTKDRFEAIFSSLQLSDVKEDEENQKKKGTP